MITLTPNTDTLRVFHTSPQGEHPPYDGIATVKYHGRQAVIHDMKADLTRKDILEIYQKLADKPMDTLLAERGEGHSLPCGEQIVDGPFKGWWSVDLTRFRNLPDLTRLRSRSKLSSFAEDIPMIKALEDSNIGENKTVITDKDGNLLVEFTRKYGEALPTADVIKIEQALLELAVKLSA